MDCECESCDVEKGATCSCSSELECQECGCGSGDPVQHMMETWHKAFHQAMYETQVERLKKRIESSFGPTLDKSADAFFESAGKIFQSMVLQAEAKRELESKLQKIFSETRK